MRRSVISLVLGVVFAAAALFFLFTSKPAPAPAAAATPTIQTVPVLVAAKDIPYGEKITPELVRTVQWPANSVPAEAITKSADLFEGPDAPRIALRPLAAQEPFLKAKVSGFGERPILSRKVAPGMRAFSVRINDVSGVAGFILPGDRVDIMMTRQAEGQANDRDNLATEVLLQNIVILGINQESREVVDEPIVARSATFEVTPEQAQKLALATQVGSLSLMLRNYATLDSEKVAPIDASDLGQRKPKPVAKPKAPPPVDNSVYVKVRKGTESKTEKVSD
jgi:pilus assembly protein CpaB